MADDQVYPDRAQPAKLRSFTHWVLWKAEERNGKQTKVPYSPHNPSRKASVTDPDTWATVQQAYAALANAPEGAFDGVGFVFTPTDPFVGVDLDHCLDPETKEPNQLATELLAHLNSYSEISPSGEGLHIMVVGEIPPGRNRNEDIEVYDRGRFFTMTGNHLEDTPEDPQPRQAALDSLFDEHLPDPVEVKSTPSTPHGTVTYQDVHRVASRGANKAKLDALWDGDTTGYPSASEADLALASILAFYTGPDVDLLEACMEGSATSRRDKWKRIDYRYKTCRKAISGQNSFFEWAPTPPPPGKGDLTVVEGGKTEKLKKKKLAVQPPLIASAKELMKKDLPPVKWVIPDILPEGVTLFAGKSKIRKSWMCLGLCVAVAAGGVALGTQQVEQGDVLYLALEDNERRIQRRLGLVLNGEECPTGFDYSTSFPRIDFGGDDHIRSWLDTHPNARLIVIDTLAKIRPRSRNQGYQEDYEAMEQLVAIANEYQVAIMVVTHTRKAEADDVVDEINATTGLMGGVDGMLILKTTRGGIHAKMWVTGREIEEEREVKLRWIQEIHSWALLSDEEEKGLLSNERRLVIRILNDEAEGQAVSPNFLVKRMDKSRQAVNHLLQALVDDNRVEKTDKGWYKIATYLPPQPEEVTDDNEPPLEPPDE